MDKELGLIIPCYNFEASLEHTITQINQWREATGVGALVCLVDDGSSDQTAVIAQKLAELHSDWLVFVGLRRNRGKGYAIRAGVKKIADRVQQVVFTDCDLYYGLSIITDRVLPLLRTGSEVVLIDRSWNKQFHTESRIRHFVSRAFNHVKAICTGVYFKDSQAGMKGFNAHVCKMIFDVCRINGFAFDVEILSVAIQHRLKIERIPIKDRSRRSSSHSSIRISSAIQMIAELLRITYLRTSGAYRVPALEARVEASTYILEENR